LEFIDTKHTTHMIFWVNHSMQVMYQTQTSSEGRMKHRPNH